MPSIEFGLIAWLEATRVVLPLKGVEARFEVTGTIASVEVDQIYHQDTAKPLDCIYTFPLPSGAAVYRCELHVNGRVIRAKVEAREEARRIFRAQKAAGRRAALVETERENLFTLTLGNVQPGDLVVVRFAWFQVLDRAGEEWRLRVPTCPGVRYIPGTPLLRGASGRGTIDDTDQVPDASRITPPRLDALHPDAAYFAIEGRMSASDVEIGTASSPSHAILVREAEDAVNVALSSRGAVPDCDFVLAWREPKRSEFAPQTWRWTQGEDAYALVQLRAPAEVKVAEDYSQDFYFLVDRSGSMSGAKWQGTCEALNAFVSLLGAEDRVWITLFESSYRDFAERPMPAPAVLADRGFQAMEALGTGGGTELLPAAIHVLDKLAGHSAGRRANIVLITDGQVGNEAEVSRAFRKFPKVRVHTFGIDTAVNDAFLKSLARQHRGGCWLQTPDDDIAGLIAGLGGRLRRPVLTDLAFQGGWEPGADAFPDLHAEEIVTIALKGHAADALVIEGRLPDRSEYRFATQIEHEGAEAIKLLWARERMATLIESGRQAEAIELGRRHNLVCEGAAFIAWDEAERVQVAQQEIVQPALRPMSRPCIMRIARAAPVGGARDLESAWLDLERSSEALEQMMRSVVGESVPSDAWRVKLAQSGIPEPAMSACAAWAEADPQHSSERIGLLSQAAEIISRLRSPKGRKMLGCGLDSLLPQMLASAPEVLVSWANECGATYYNVAKSRQTLRAAQLPEEVVDQLVVWTWESPALIKERAARLQAFADSLANPPFSEASAVPRWRAFIVDAIAADSQAYPVISRWLASLPLGAEAQAAM